MHDHNNKAKTLEHIFSHATLYWNVEVATHKVLGVTIDNNLSWKNNVNELTKRVSQKLYQLAKIKHFLNARARKLFYAHIQPIIDYAPTLCFNTLGLC